MPSFDFTSEADMAALKNAIDVTSRQIDNRYDFKGTSAKVELNEKDKVITLLGRFRLPARPDQGPAFPGHGKEGEGERQAPGSPEGSQRFRQQGQAGNEDQGWASTAIWPRRSSS
jgi:hypothetical protein